MHSLIRFASTGEAQSAAHSVAAGRDFGYPYSIFWPDGDFNHQTIRIESSEPVEPLLGDFYPRLPGFLSAQWDMEHLPT